jgi:hypothetical protein
MKLKKYFAILAITGALLLPIVSLAQGSLLTDPIIADAACTKGGTCTLNTFIALGVNVANFILGIVGALTLIMFIYGGFLWILSGGSSESVKKGKDVIVGSVVGLLIVFSSYMIINYITNDVLKAKQENGTNAFTGSAPADNPKTTQTGVQIQTSAECASLSGTCVKSSCGTDKINQGSKGCLNGSTCCTDFVVSCEGLCVKGTICTYMVLGDGSGCKSGSICCLSPK